MSARWGWRLRRLSDGEWFGRGVKHYKQVGEHGELSPRLSPNEIITPELLP